MSKQPVASMVLRIAGALSACSVWFWSSNSAVADRDHITIGVVLPLTGEAAHWGIPPRNGAQLAVEEVNRAGGVGGRDLELYIEDDRCKPAEGVAAFNKIMVAASPSIILGAVCSGVTLAIAPLAEMRKVVLISPASTSPKLTGAGEFIFRVVPSGGLRGKVFAEYVHHDRALRKVAGLYINNEGGIGGSTSFKARFAQLGGTLVIEETYAPGTTDLRPQLARIKAAGAEGVLIGSYPPDTVAICSNRSFLRLRRSRTRRSCEKREMRRTARSISSPPRLRARLRKASRKPMQRNSEKCRSYLPRKAMTLCA